MAKLVRDGVSLYYEVHGDGPVLLLTHGFSATSQMWKGQIDPLAPHFKVVTWDMRGHGQSDYPADPAAYSEEATVADMAALLDAVGAKEAIVGGLSLGGYMSLAFHRTHPNRVRALLMAVNLDGKPGWQRVMLPATFYNMMSLQWVQGDCVDNKSHMFDNILVMPGISAR